MKPLSLRTHAVLTAIPSSIAMLVQSVMVVVVMLHGPLKSGSWMALLLWLIFESLSGFFFGQLSDKRNRKLFLMIFQFTGVVCGFILLHFNLDIVVMCIVAFFFNPTPVCRAAFLDNFPMVSPLRVLGITYIITYLPQAGFPLFYLFTDKQVITVLLIVMLFNTPLMWFLFKDNYDKVHPSETDSHTSKLSTLLFKNLFMKCLVLAFFLAETPFNVMWDYLDLNVNIRYWFPLISTATIAGIMLTMIVAKRLPHLLMITLIYAVSFTFPLIMYAIYHFQLLTISPAEALLTYTTFACALGGLYLPLVADAIIGRLGHKHRGFGAALIEFVDTSSSSITAPLVTEWFNGVVVMLLPLFGGLFFLATIFQNIAQKQKEPN